MVTTGLNTLARNDSTSALEGVINATTRSQDKTQEIMAKRFVDSKNPDRQDKVATIAGLRAVAFNQPFEVVKACGDYKNESFDLTVPKNDGTLVKLALDAGDCKGVLLAVKALEEHYLKQNAFAGNAAAKASQVYLQTVFESMKPTALGELDGLKDWKSGDKITMERLNTLSDAMTAYNHKNGADKSIEFTATTLVNLNSAYIEEAKQEAGGNSYLPNSIGPMVLARQKSNVTQAQLVLRDNQIVATPVIDEIVAAKGAFLQNLQPKLKAEGIGVAVVRDTVAYKAMTPEAALNAISTFQAIEEDRPATAQESRRNISFRETVPVEPPGGNTPPPPGTPPGGGGPPPPQIPPTPPGGDVPPPIPPGGDVPPPFLIPPTPGGGGPGTPGGGVPDVPSTGGGGGFTLGVVPIPSVTFGGPPQKQPEYIFQTPPEVKTPIDILNPPIDKPPVAVPEPGSAGGDSFCWSRFGWFSLAFEQSQKRRC